MTSAIFAARAIDATAMHAKVKFIGVAICNLAAHGLDARFLSMKIFGSETVVSFLLEEAEVGSGLGLGALLVGDALDGIAEGGHGEL